MHILQARRFLILTIVAFATTLAAIVQTWRNAHGRNTVHFEALKAPSPTTPSKPTFCNLGVFTREDVQMICSTSVATPICLVEHIGHLKSSLFIRSSLRLPSGQAMKIFFNPVVEGMARRIANDGIWEKDRVTLVMTALRALPMKTALIDVGCNFGVYTLAAASLGHRVIAIDTNYHLTMRVRKSVEENSLQGRVDVFWNAMSATRTNVKMRYESNCDFGLLQTYNSPQGVSYFEDPVEVPGIGLDEIVLSNPSLNEIENLVIKVDIEGSEWNVFATAGGTFDRFSVSMVLMEWSFTTINFPHKTEFLCSFFTSRGFSAYNLMGARPVGQALRVEDRLRWPADVLWINKKSGLLDKLAGSQRNK